MTFHELSGRPLMRILFLFLHAFLSTNAAAEIIFRDNCYVFTGETGKNKEVKFCPTSDAEIVKLNTPLQARGKSWEWVARNPDRRGGLLPDSRNALVYVQDYYDVPAEAAPGKEPKQAFAMDVVERGYRVSYFSGSGRMLWDKVVPREGRVIDQRISYDGSLIILLMEPNIPLKYPPEKPNGPPAHWLTIYDNKGVRLMDFPKRDGLCNFFSIYSFWISKTGKYMMADCRREFKQQTGSYFLQPKARLFWAADRPYRIDLGWKKKILSKEDPWTDEDEEFGRLDLETTSNGVLWEQTDLTLAGVDWKPITELR